MNYSKISNLVLRFGLALTYLFSGYDLIANPTSWSNFVPFWMKNLLPVDVLTFIQIQGGVELLLALALLTGFFMRPAAFISALEMVGILLLYGVDAVTFRDLAILGASLAVFFSTFASNQVKTDTPVTSEGTSTPTGPKLNLTVTQKRLRIILVASSFVLFSIIFIGLFWLSSTTKDQTGWLAFSYATGLSMIVLPCTLPLAFVIVPLAMGKDAKKGLAIAFAFALGVTITLSMYGALIAKLGQVVGLDRAKDTMYLIAGAFAVIFGFGELGLIKMRVPTYAGAFPKFIQDRKDAAKGFLLGLLLGNVGLGCPNPAFYVLLAHIATVGSMSTGWFLTFVHAVGRVTPLLLLAILAVLGVDALTSLMKRREALTRATAWGVVGVGAFILTFGLLGHDWYVYSGIHSMLEIVTQETSFVTQYADQFGGLAHSHDMPTGPWLPYGSWLMVTLIAVPLVWNMIHRKKEIIVDNPESARAYKWFRAYTILLILFLYTLFVFAIPNWYRYQSTMMMAGHGTMVDPNHTHAPGTPAVHDHNTMTPADTGVDIKMTTSNRMVRGQSVTTLSFEVIDVKTGKAQTNLEISHGEMMHVVGARQGDLKQFFHIHPQVINGKFVVEHTFTQPGTYSIWPGIVYNGAHVNPKMSDLVVGAPPSMASFVPDFSRVQRVGNAVVTMKAATTLNAGIDHNIGFAITDSGGFDIPLGKYLLENMHINIISPDARHYHHLHTNYGMIGTDGHGAGAHMHSLLPSFWSLIPIAYADGGVDHGHGTGSNEEQALTFGPKDMRILFNFPEPGRYKIFTEFVTQQNPNQVQLAEFWVDVGQPLPTKSWPKWLLALVSTLLIAAVLPLIFRYLNEEKIKV
ncbi:MAG: sulfite exporter TauE/SafE family protein [Candidatus Doudnabacteria bacterium]|nr:sulfite exporter TauE/SafE family protein [Candidatus Doudnabacteria bacterium]